MSKIKFEDLGLSEDILKAVYKRGFEKPSSIQVDGIKAILTKKDSILQSQSGTGKTATYLLGVLQLLDMNDNTTQGIIMVPTHDLANQIYKDAVLLSTDLNMSVVKCIGATSLNESIIEIKKQPHLIIGTVGRIDHMINKKILKTGNVKIVVLDEADEMLSIGFKEKVYDILCKITANFQLCLLSATIPKNIRELMASLTRNPIEILLRNSEVSVQSIKQFFVDVEKEEYKFDVLLDLYKVISTSQTIIYCNTINKVEWLANKLKENDFPISWVHGEIDHEERNKVVNEFRNGHNRILLTTDLLARGIDIPEISLVINFDLPASKENYIHRIGRSGRFGRKGIAINFVKMDDESDMRNFNKIRNYFKIKIDFLPENIMEYLQ
jgi:superfamily II DNA/RNA helicase